MPIRDSKGNILEGAAEDDPAGGEGTSTSGGEPPSGDVDGGDADGEDAGGVDADADADAPSTETGESAGTVAEGGETN